MSRIMPVASGSVDSSDGSTGGGSGPGRPVRRLTKACWIEVNRRAASASVSAATTFSPSMAWGLASRSEGRNSSRYMASASSIWAGAKWEAKA